jgi:hypothetical protein
MACLCGYCPWDAARLALCLRRTFFFFSCCGFQARGKKKGGSQPALGTEVTGPDRWHYRKAHPLPTGFHASTLPRRPEKRGLAARCTEVINGLPVVGMTGRRAPSWCCLDVVNRVTGQSNFTLLPTNETSLELERVWLGEAG